MDLIALKKFNLAKVGYLTFTVSNVTNNEMGTKLVKMSSHVPHL
jgi:hypothetical protein